MTILLTRIRTLLTVVGVLGMYLSSASCSKPPTTPSTYYPSGLDKSWKVYGTAWIYGPGGAVPASGGKVWGWIESGRSGDGGEAIGGWPIDPSGHYVVSIPAGIRWVRLQGPQFQPCGVTIEPTSPLTNIDIQLVPDPNLLGASLPAELRNQGPTLSGIVFEETPQGPQPLANSSVQLRQYGGDGFLVASTMTDSDGRYALCRVPFLQGLTLITYAQGFADVEIYMGTNVRQTQDVSMRRQ